MTHEYHEPKVGEVYETSAGNRYRIEEIEDGGKWIYTRWLTSISKGDRIRLPIEMMSKHCTKLVA